MQTWIKWAIVGGTFVLLAVALSQCVSRELATWWLLSGSGE